MGRKNSDKVVESRRAELEQRLMLGRLNRKQQQAFADEWGITARMVREDTQKIVERWRKEQNDTSADDHRARLLKESETIKTIALRNGKEVVALRTLEFQAQLTGAAAPAKLEVTHTVDRGNPEEIAKRVIKALPLACDVLGIQAPEIEAIDVEWTEEG